MVHLPTFTGTKCLITCCSGKLFAGQRTRIV